MSGMQPMSGCTFTIRVIRSLIITGAIRTYLSELAALKNASAFHEEKTRNGI